MRETLINNFLRISRIPRESGHEQKIADFFVNIAKENNLYYFKDENNLKTIEKGLSLGIKPENTYTISDNLKLKGKSFVITGTLNEFSRDKAQEILKSLGAKTPSAVSRNTDFVIAGENPGSKLEKAKSLGIKILDEEEFKKLIEN